MILQFTWLDFITQYLGQYESLLGARIGARCDCQDTGGNLESFGAEGAVPTVNLYFTGGGNGLTSPYSTTEILNTTTETFAISISAQLSFTMFTHASVTDGTTGYMCGGFGDAPTWMYADKIVFATDTTSTAGFSLVDETIAAMGVGDQTSGYIIGGFIASQDRSAATTKITYATETSSTSPLLLTDATLVEFDQDFVFEAGNTSSLTKGYVTSGRLFGVRYQPNSDVLTFATETIVNTPSAGLSTNRSDTGSAGNADFGFFIGGENSVANNETGPLKTSDKLTYTTDTAAANAATALAENVMNICGTGTDTYGYFNGGYYGEQIAAYRNITERIQYATDTLSLPSSAILQDSAKSSMEATGPSFY